ncbi:glyoxalase [Candidatus Peregrinibacteria bacterium CG_4_9_14_0_2_um_filter_53_11]|nr:MAG: glyoxalase [Candidatus Peregrinibacteria bacterium CG_4_9_14_0_2_um_filter_53_11]
MNRVIHFEIQADKPQRAIDFYTAVFGWKFERWKKDEYWLITTAGKDSKEPGIDGGLLPRKTRTPPDSFGSNAYVCSIQVESFDKTAKKILSEGGAITMPKFALPKMAWQGYFMDTEGNTFGVHQPDPKAM